MSKNTTKNLYRDSGFPNFNPLSVAKAFTSPERVTCLMEVKYVRESGETFFLILSFDSNTVGQYFSCLPKSAAELFISCFETMNEIPSCKVSDKFFAAVIVSLVQSPRLTDRDRAGFIEFFQNVEQCSGVSVHCGGDSGIGFPFLNDFAF